MIKAINLSHTFDYPLFSNVNITLKAKESMAIIGVSGSGKSTLLHILSTFLKPLKGSVKMYEDDLYNMSRKKLLKLRRYQIGIIFQQHYLFKGFTAFENIQVSCLLSKNSIDIDLLKRLGIHHLMDKKITDLSGGEQQRISIARVLTKKPKMIFADEPTGNLDEDTAFNVIDILQEYIDKNSACLIMVTHDQRLAKRCKKQYHLINKQLTLE